MASDNRGYWSRSWELLTRDSGWIKPVLVLAAARFVPIVGPFGADGYGLEWARLTSWGVDSSPKQKGVDISACIRTGAKAFVVSLGYAAALVALNWISGLLLGQTLGGILYLALSYVGMVLILVAKLRATIYQTIGAGYQVDRIADMVKRDYKGLLRIAGLILLMAIASALVFSILFSVVVAVSMGGAVSELARMGIYGYSDDWVVVSTVMKALASVMPAICVLMFAVSVVHSFTSLIQATAVGLWMRQFDVTNWGESSDPLPSDQPHTSATSTEAQAEYPGLPAAQGQASASQPHDQGWQGATQGTSETSGSANGGHAYSSRTSVWDTAPAADDAAARESSADTATSSIPVTPLESFGTGDTSGEAPASEPQSFGLWDTEAPAEASPLPEPEQSPLADAETIPTPEPFGLWDNEAPAEESTLPEPSPLADAAPAAAPEPFAPWDTEATADSEMADTAEVPMPESEEGSLSSEESPVPSMPLDAFDAHDAYETDGPVEDAGERPADEVEMFPLFEIPAPTTTFEAEDAEGVVEQGVLPEEARRRTLAERLEAEPASEEDVLRRVEAVIRDSDMTAWDIPQTVQPAGEGSSFSLDAFEGQAQLEDDLLVQEAQVAADPETVSTDDAEERPIHPTTPEMPPVAGPEAHPLANEAAEADAASAAEDAAERVVESVILAGAKDTEEDAREGEEPADAQEDA